MIELNKCEGELGSSNILTFLKWILIFLYLACIRSVSFWFYSYVPNPVLVIIDVQPKELGIPSKAYYVVEEVKEVRTMDIINVFLFIGCIIYQLHYIQLKNLGDFLSKACHLNN